MYTRVLLVAMGAVLMAAAAAGFAVNHAGRRRAVRRRRSPSSGRSWISSGVAYPINRT
jgi:hypothetical protein